MSPDLLATLLPRLEAEYGFKRTANGWLRQGKCPQCGKKELYTSAEHPWVLKCGRLDKCGYQAHVKEIFPEIFADWSARAKARQAAQPQAPVNPNAAADMYLSEGRGFDLGKIKGWYSQESYFDPEADRGRGAGTATVRFPMGSGYWERLIDRPERFGKKKARFKYGWSYAGTWWCPPSVRLDGGGEIWLVEGIFDAIALLHHGINAVALLTCNNYPEVALQELRASLAQRGQQAVTLVWALDSDSAGSAYVRRWFKRATEDGWTCKAAQIPQSGAKKVDWSDLHLFERLEPENIKRYLFQGALLTAESAIDKALLIYHDNSQGAAFPFGYDNNLYWFKLNFEAYERAKKEIADKEDLSPEEEEEARDKALRASASVRRIARCYPTALYYQRNQLTDESWYYFRVDFPHDAPAIKATFSPASVTAAAEFKKRLVAIAPGAIFEGTTEMLDRLMSQQLYRIRRVETVDFIGYSREFQTYVLGDVAVKAGQIVDINAEDFFNLPGGVNLKSLNQSVTLTINHDPAEYSTAWVDLLWTCFGPKGMATLAFWLGTLFAEQIRAAQKSFPFLEVVGEAGAGKSTLIEFLWKLFGRRDYEGFDPSKSSLAARARNFAQVANLPVVLIESDRERGEGAGAHVKSFDWDELKTAYNGRSVRARGMATGGNETYEPPFRGAIVISQNNPVAASDAIMQRICHILFDRSGQTPRTREAAMKLEAIPVEQVSGFILRCAKFEDRVLEILTERTPAYEAELLASGAVKSMRLAKNHAQILALADALAMVLHLDDERHAATLAQIRAMAAERQIAINADVPMVAEFWDTFEYLDAIQGCEVNHSRKAGDLIAVNINHFYQVARDKGQQLPLITELKKVLRTSRRYRFIESNRAVNSDILDRTIRCWIFARPASKTTPH